MFINRTYKKLMLSLGLILLSLNIQAADIDIFTSNPDIERDNPNILIVLDNTANWSSSMDGATRFEHEMEALIGLVKGLDDKVNVGLMLLTSPTDGGYVRFGVRPMTDNNKALLIEVLDKMDEVKDKSSGASVYGLALFEAYKYFGGGGPGMLPQGPDAFGSSVRAGVFAGSSDREQTERDYFGNPAIYGLLPLLLGGWDSSQAALSDAADRTYNSPIEKECAHNFIIVISNGLPPQNSEPEAAQLLVNVGGNPTSIPLNSLRAETNYGDEMARFLSKVDVRDDLPGNQRIFTYTIAVADPDELAKKNSIDKDNVELMKSTANQGEGAFFLATDAESLRKALEKTLIEILAVDSVFASVTLPVSVNVRGTHANQVYMGVFRPNENGLPQWQGNLKHYKLALDTVTEDVFLADANGEQVHSNITGFVKEGAQSIWTENSSFWKFLDAPDYSNPAIWSDNPDGPQVEKGGVAQHIRDVLASSQASRQMLTIRNSAANTNGSDLQDFSTSNGDLIADLVNLPAPPVGLYDPPVDDTEAKLIIDWFRGADNIRDENADKLYTDVRTTVHGDVIHSQPAVINFATSASDSSADDKVVIYYSSNDGILRSVQGGKAAGAGRELWAFVAPESYSIMKPLRDNSTTGIKTYGFDGPITTATFDDNGTVRHFIFATARRGGNFIYAFEVFNPFTSGFPAASTPPKFLWRLNATELPGLGQTWSSPIPFYAKAPLADGSALKDPVLMFAGGYSEDEDRTTPTYPANEGNAIYIVNLKTGKLLVTLDSGMKYPIPSDMTLIDRDGDGFNDRAYVGDMGGHIWRVDLAVDDLKNSTLSEIASLGVDGPGAANTNRRKFFYPPDVVYTKDSVGKYDAIVIGSGDREKPFEQTVQNMFFVIKDRAITGLPSTVIKLSDLDDATSTSTIDDSKPGGYIKLLPGEKVISKAITLAGIAMFNTNQPASATSGTTCEADLGIARLYAVYIENLSGANEDGERFEISPGGGYPPSPTGIVVQLDDGKGGTTIEEVICSGTNCRKAPESSLYERFRAFWTEIID